MSIGNFDKVHPSYVCVYIFIMRITKSRFRKLLAFALIFLAHWFFGNVYEEIVLAPNQLVNPVSALQCWQEYFTVTNQIYYYVPMTQLAVVIVLILYLIAREPRIKSALGRGSFFGGMALQLTALIITQLNVKIFFGDLAEHHAHLYNLSLLWIIGNAIRIILVGAALYHTFNAFLLVSNGTSDA